MENLLSLIDKMTHDYCEQLAISLHIKTGLSVCAIYDVTERSYSWGTNYWAYFIKVKDNCYLNATGLNCESELTNFWAEAWQSEDLIKNSRIIERMPQYNMYVNHSSNYIPGLEGPILPIVDQFADFLIRLHLNN